ncbi:MAG: 5-formyltetrahydrofolate cyclo-ligase [Treponema sp.]|jgi:5-formyltetrahydrofolate cyclo-ligase|nr:5-formyltetrahydrofolate cyclo-ligase [Treponema sp.]
MKPRRRGWPPGENRKCSAKERLRRSIKERLAGLSAGQFGAEGKKAAGLLCASPLWKRYSSILLFLSLKDEIDTGPLLEAAFAEKKRVFVPRVEKNGLAFYEARPSGPRAKGPSGPLPAGETAERPLSPEDFPALIIVPGLAFDLSGRRLGRGKGCYDRFFAELEKNVPAGGYKAIGLCMEIQIKAGVPASSSDKKMDGLLSAAQLIYF